MAVTRVPVSKSVLEWAITRAGYDTSAYTTRKPKVKNWLDGTSRPTVKQLEDFSRDVHVPFGYLFLDTPPELELSFPFFRTGKKTTRQVSVNVYDMVLIIQGRQSWLVEYLEEEEYEPLDYVGKFSINDRIEDVVSDIKKTLRLKDNWASEFNTWQDALDHLTKKIEKIETIISYSSYVGNSTKRKIEVSECRGFVLVDKYAPFIFINSGDAKAAQMFTIGHELAHIWIGESAGFDQKQLMPSSDKTEVFCDKVAAEFLVPEALFKKEWIRDDYDEYIRLSKIFKASPIVVARRALDLSYVEKAGFFDFYDKYIQSIPLRKSGGGSSQSHLFGVRKKVGATFFEQIHLAAKNSKISHRELYQLTGVSAKTYDSYVEKFLS